MLSGIHLASCKLVGCEARSEVSRTAKVCTDEQESITGMGKWLRLHSKPKATIRFTDVDAAGVNRRSMFLPGEASA